MNDLVVTGDEIAQNGTYAPGQAHTPRMHIVDSSNHLLQDIRDGEWDSFTTYADGAFFALDAIGFYLNPLGGVIRAGVGWLFEHVAFIREPLEFLTGDPNVVRAMSDTWQNIGNALAAAEDDYRDLLRDVQDWSGRAADSYRSLAESYATGLAGLSGYATNLSNGLTVAATAVATTRVVLFEILIVWVTGIIQRAVIAAASAWFTGGASIAAFLSSTIADAAMLLGRIVKKVRRLAEVLRRFTGRFDALRGKSDDLYLALRRTQQSLGGFAGQRLATAGRPDLRNAAREASWPGTHKETLRNIRDWSDAYNRFPKEAIKQTSREYDREEVEADVE